MESGPFEAAYSLRDSGDVEASDSEALAEHLGWFEQHLDTPSRFNRTTSKGFYRRRTRGIAWFKDTATEHVARMHAVAAILERYDRPLSRLSRARVGNVFAGADRERPRRFGSSKRAYSTRGQRQRQGRHPLTQAISREQGCGSRTFGKDGRLACLAMNVCKPPSVVVHDRAGPKRGMCPLWRDAASQWRTTG